MKDDFSLVAWNAVHLVFFKGMFMIFSFGSTMVPCSAGLIYDY